MKVLVTGATGFIGKHVVQALVDNNMQVDVLTRSVGCDLFNAEAVDQLLQKSQAKVLIHLAWDVTHGEYWNSSKNTQYKDASISLFKKFLALGGEKIIGIGTSAEYPTSDKPVNEEMAVSKASLTPYGQEKRACFEWLKAHHDDFTWIRIFGVYGAGEDDRKFFASAIRSIKENTGFKIGKPDTFSDYIHVKDMAKFIAFTAAHPGLEAINVGSGNSYAMLDIYNGLKNYVDAGVISVQKSIEHPSGDSRIPDVTKLESLGWKFSLMAY